MTKKDLFLGWAICVVIILSSCQKSTLPTFAVSDHRQPAQVTNTPFMPEVATAILPSPSPSPVPSLTPTQTPTLLPSPTVVSCSGEQGWMEVHTREEGAPLVYRIYLPPCYGMLADVRYPVLYILHGQTYNDDQWDRLGMDEAAEAIIQARQAPPFIIVMPLEANTLADPFETMFGTHLAEELVPWIDAHYATCAERDCRAIGGLSRGGAWALNTGFRYWELFGSIGLHSTPPFINDPYRLRDWLLAIPEGQQPRLWLDTGKLDWYLKITTEFEALLVAQNVPHEWYLFNGTHDEAYWSAHVGDYLYWYSWPWQERFPYLP